MEAKIIRGAAVAEGLRSQIQQDVHAAKALGYSPCLRVLLVGNDPGSVWYAQNKVKVGEKLGVRVTIIKYPDDVAQDELIRQITALNADDSVHGLLVELPLPKQLNKTSIMNAISPLKDVDGVTAVNRGYIMGGQESLALVPATPLACIQLVESAGISLRGKKVTLVGRGDTVGRPLASLLINRDATVTVCHTKTADMAEECWKAEILIAAAGHRHLITADMVSEGTVVIDAGINQIEDGSFTGDVDFEAVKEKAYAITPVPGGVGSLTTTVIMANTLRALKLQNGLEMLQ